MAFRIRASLVPVFDPLSGVQKVAVVLMQLNRI